VEQKKVVTHQAAAPAEQPEGEWVHKSDLKKAAAKPVEEGKPPVSNSFLQLDNEVEGVWVLKDTYY
jgi:hypothetical protein